jgi:DNA-directed RNA polymerase subunit RPC12/RpoP
MMDKKELLLEQERNLNKNINILTEKLRDVLRQLLLIRETVGKGKTEDGVGVEVEVDYVCVNCSNRNARPTPDGWVCDYCFSPWVTVPRRVL